MKKRLILLIFILLIMSGCATNYFAKYYYGMTYSDIEHSNHLQSCDKPLTVYTDDIDTAINHYIALGYRNVGGSNINFKQGTYSPQHETAQAKKIGACVILTQAKYAGSQQEVVTTYSSVPTIGNATIYNNTLGYTTVSSYSTTIIPQQHQQTVNIYNIKTAYFVKTKSDTPESDTKHISELFDSSDIRSDGYIILGATMEEVKTIQGEPISTSTYGAIDSEVWYYDRACSVTFSIASGRVISYDNFGNFLKVK